MSYIFLLIFLSFEYFPLVISMRSCSLDVRFYVELLFSFSVIFASVDLMTLNRFKFVLKLLFPVGSFLFSFACLGLSLLCCRFSSNVC